MNIEKNGFFHHVFFWLKNPESKEDLKQLIEGLQKLSKAPTIREFHIGKPANTDRPVIDSSYSASWLVLFENKEEHDAYQIDPIHLKFVDECSRLWNRVVIYDAVSAVG